MVTEERGKSNHIVKEVERKMVNHVQHEWEIREKKKNKEMITCVARTPSRKWQE